jgi:hypothetical protein
MSLAMNFFLNASVVTSGPAVASFTDAMRFSSRTVLST